MKYTLLSIGVACVLGAGCERKPTVVVEAPLPNPPAARRVSLDNFDAHDLRKEINLFAERPTDVQAARVQKAFAEVDGEIAETMERAAKRSGEDRANANVKLADLRAFREAEHSRFNRVQASTPVIAEPRESVGERVGEKVDDAARGVGRALQDVGKAIQEGAR